MALSANDLAKILNGVQKMIDFAVKDLEGRLSEKIKLLPTKEEFFSRMDENMGELQTARTERTTMFAQYERVEEDVRKLKTIHPQNRHSVAHA